MLKKLKALVEPLERLLTTLGTKGPKSNTTHNGGTQFTCFNKQQVSDLQKRKPVNNFVTSNKSVEQTRLYNFLFDNFSICKAFSFQPVPSPVVFSRIPLRVHKQQGFGIISQHAFLQPVGTSNIFGRGVRNFSTIQPVMLNNGTSTSSAILAQLCFKPFTTFSSKSGSLWFQKQESLNKNNQELSNINKRTTKKKEKEMGRQFLVLNSNKGISDIVKDSKIIEDNTNRRIACRSNIKNLSETSKTVEKSPEVFVNDSESIQVYMSIILSSSICWNNDYSTSMSNSTNSINSTIGVLSDLLQHKNNSVSQKPGSQLNSSLVRHLQEIAEMQHNHMMEVISILGALLRHGDFGVEIYGCELRVNFPRGMRKIEVENLLQSLSINPDSPHFELEEFIFDGSIAISPLTNENVDMQLPEPNNSYFDNELAETATISDLSSSFLGYEVLSYLSSNDSSPVLLPSRISVDNIIRSPSPCMSPVNSPPRLGTEYIIGIQEFLSAVDEALVNNTTMFNSREDDDEIGEDYYEN
ncbi:4839_t:CDS:1 [Funneliformis geosporum]|uniref:7266_t:CDS:1 n=1 Tax=Funneliformis geosporum TaxID=1117311 RepID=A0A9W4SCH6_9GLOM|nr:7266_t:CDS:1 [Funneliformis geosporum]CAI2164705.1 4839_t:CDS:1 [Funneliformis geosporum]